MKVITIEEENHGFIGVAKDMDSAFRFLIEEDWLNDGLWDEDVQDWVHPDVLIEKHNAKNLLDLLKMLYEKDKYAFEGMFYFSEETVFE